MGVLQPRFVVRMLAVWLCAGSLQAQFDPFGGSRGTKLTRELVPAPRELKQHLLKAQEAIEEQRYDEAFARLDELLKPATPDYFLTTKKEEEGEGGDEKDTETEASDDRRTVKGEAMRLLAQFDQNGRKVLQLRYESEAAAALEQAVAERDLGRLDFISRRYLGTEAAGTATLIGARLWLEKGSPWAAAVRLSRFQDHPLASQHDPQLSLLLASCWHRADETERAREVLLALHDRLEPKTVRIGGQQVAWINDPSELDDWMRRWFEVKPSTERPPVELTAPVATSWQSPAGENKTEQQTLEALEAQYTKHQIPAIPVLHPAADDEWLVLRFPHRLFGLDPDGGKRIWTYPSRPGPEIEDSLVTESEKGKFLTLAGRDLHRRTWSDQVYGGLTRNGRWVYFIDNLPPAEMAKAMPGVQLGIRPVRFPLPVRGRNRLVALDLKREGAMAWSVGYEPGDPLQDAFFLSAPVVDQGNLYLLAELEQQIQVLSLDAATGELMWSQSLIHVDPEAIQKEPARRLEGGKLVLHDRQLICWTAANYVFGVDLVERRLAWRHEVPGPSQVAGKASKEIQFQPPLPEHMYYYSGEQALRWNEMLKYSMPGDHWSETNILTQGRYAVITPRNGNEILCLDLYDGKPVWQQPRGDFLYAGCVYDDAILFVGRFRLAMLRLRDGRPTWQDHPYVAIPSSGIPSGRGARLGDVYYVPTTTGELMAVDLQTGRARGFPTNQKLGNLATVGNLLISQSAGGVVALTTASQDAAASAGQEDPPTEQAAELVKQLGARPFQDREAAEQRLVALGANAIAAVRAGIDSPDPEVRTRCRRIIDHVQKDVRKKQLVAFRKEAIDKPVSLPGWERFIKLVGDSESARMIFADMYESEHRLFDALEEGKDSLPEMVNRRGQELQNAMSQLRYQLTLPNVATMLFLAADGEAAKNSVINQYTASFCYQNSFRNAMQQDEQRDVLKTMLVTWMKKVTDDSNYQIINLGLQFDLKECLPIARNMLKKKTIRGSSMAYTVLAIARFGDKQDVPLLESLLEDESVCTRYSTNNLRYTTETRDVALASLIHLHKKNPKDFGFDRLETQPNYLYALHTMGFAGKEDRDKAFEKWKAAQKQDGAAENQDDKD